MVLPIIFTLLLTVRFLPNLKLPLIEASVITDNPLFNVANPVKNKRPFIDKSLFTYSFDIIDTSFTTYKRPLKLASFCKNKRLFNDKSLFIVVLPATYNRLFIVT